HAAGIRCRSRRRSSGRARWRCCRTSPRARTSAAVGGGATAAIAEIVATGETAEMEVILLSDVDHVGLRGDVVSVARGYARNFLLPRRLAEEATPPRVAELQKRESHRPRHEAKSAEQANEIAEILSKTVLRFDVKEGPTRSRLRAAAHTNNPHQR